MLPAGLFFNVKLSNIAIRALGFLNKNLVVIDVACRPTVKPAIWLFGDKEAAALGLRNFYALVQKLGRVLIIKPSVIFEFGFI